MSRFDGKIAMVTGGSRAMGAETVRVFAAGGAKVLIADILEEEGQALAREIGPHAAFVRLDVSDEADWQAARDEAARTFGAPDILVNNAAIVKFQDLLTMEVKDFERVLQVNLTGCFLGMKTIAPGMIAKGKGAIVNISSIDGMTGANCVGAYTASKWGLRGLTKTAALEFGYRGVRVNSVHPGGVDTQMGNPYGKSAADLAPEYAKVPLQRIGQSIEIAHASAFLCSDEGSYINGAELAVDGGWTAGHYYMGFPGSPGS